MKIPNTLAIFTVSYTKETENRWILNFVLSDRKHFEHVISEGRRLHVLAAATGNADRGQTSQRYS